MGSSFFVKNFWKDVDSGQKICYINLTFQEMNDNLISTRSYSGQDIIYVSVGKVNIPARQCKGYYALKSHKKSILLIETFLVS